MLQVRQGDALRAVPDRELVRFVEDAHDPLEAVQEATGIDPTPATAGMKKAEVVERSKHRGRRNGLNSSPSTLQKPAANPSASLRACSSSVRRAELALRLANFQFLSSGGSFCINISFRKETVPRKLKVNQTRVQSRLGAANLVGDIWFSFGPTSYGEVRGNLQAVDQLVKEVNQFFTEAAVLWWNLKAAREQ